jgi:hypothetical protein
MLINLLVTRVNSLQRVYKSVEIVDDYFRFSVETTRLTILALFFLENGYYFYMRGLWEHINWLQLL